MVGIGLRVLVGGGVGLGCGEGLYYSILNFIIDMLNSVIVILNSAIFILNIAIVILNLILYLLGSFTAACGRIGYRIKSGMTGVGWHGVCWLVGVGMVCVGWWVLVGVCWLVWR